MCGGRRDVAAEGSLRDVRCGAVRGTRREARLVMFDFKSADFTQPATSQPASEGHVPLHSALITALRTRH